MAKGVSRHNAILIEFCNLPIDIQKAVKKHAAYKARSIIEYTSPLEIKEINEKGIQEFHRQMIVDHLYPNNDRKQFIKDNEIELDQWLVEQRVDLRGVDMILINTAS